MAELWEELNEGSAEIDRQIDEMEEREEAVSVVALTSARIASAVLAANVRIDDLRASVTLAHHDLSAYQDVEGALVRLSDALAADDAAMGGAS